MLDTGGALAKNDLGMLTFGNGGGAGNPNTLDFTAGLASNTDGLFGSLRPTPEPNAGPLIALGGAILGVYRS
jgi:hypothetical protein